MGYNRLIVKRWLSSIKQSEENRATQVYSETNLIRVGAVVLASTLPVLAIVILSLVTRMERRLAIIAAFTATFSTLLGMFSSGREIEIFSATSA